MTSTPNQGGPSESRSKETNDDFLKKFLNSSGITLTSVGSKSNHTKDSDSDSSNSSQYKNKEKTPVSHPKENPNQARKEPSASSSDFLKQFSHLPISFNVKKAAPEGASSNNALDHDEEASDSDSGASRNSYDSPPDSPQEKTPNFRCSKCQALFNVQVEFLQHFVACNKTPSGSSETSKKPESKSQTSSVKDSASKPVLPPSISIASGGSKPVLPPSISIASRSSLSITSAPKASLDSDYSGESSRSATPSPEPGKDLQKTFDRPPHSQTGISRTAKSLLPSSISISSHPSSQLSNKEPAYSSDSANSSRSSSPVHRAAQSSSNSGEKSYPKHLPQNTESRGKEPTSQPFLPPGISISRPSNPVNKEKRSCSPSSGESSPRSHSPSSHFTKNNSVNPSKNLVPNKNQSNANGISQDSLHLTERASSASSNYSLPPSTVATQRPKRNISRKSTARNSVISLPCWVCKILSFQSFDQFEEHHKLHVTDKIRVSLSRLSASQEKALNPYPSEESDNSRGSNSNASNSLSKESLKLTFKISRVKKRGRGRKKKTVEIISSEGMNEDEEEDTAEESNEGYPSEREASMPEENIDHSISQDETMNPGEPPPYPQENHHQSESLQNPFNENEVTGASATSERSSSEEQSFEGFEDPNMNFGPAAPNEAPPSAYQPQFESFTGEWWGPEFESGPRIAAALAGSTESSGTSASYPPASNSQNKDIPNPANQEGLFSEEVLGNEHRQDIPNDQRQGSFEQLCLNDSYQNQGDVNMGHTNPANAPPPYDQTQSSGDLLSELEYLNNTSTQQQPLDHTQMPQHSAGEMTHMNAHIPNSVAPNSAASPVDTSFRALATSPHGSSPHVSSPSSPLRPGYTPPLQHGVVAASPPMHSGQTSPLPASSSLQQMGQMGMTPPQTSQETVTTPRLTIANNLMPTTTSSSLGNFMGSYSGSQWTPGNPPSNYTNTYMPGPTMPTPLRGHASLPAGYRPSPPPRIRGRPPLMSPRPMIRGPGRPPVAMPGVLPSAGNRGGMMQNFQRMPQNMYSSSQRQSMGQKRGGPQNSASPSKSLRREDITVPSRQKDNECQIIAVANRTDGMPVISNVQGSREERNSRSSSSPVTTTESTIHLSDSITLSVRQNSPNNSTRQEKGGDAGVVANLLASRGITVTPAAGDKEGGGSAPQVNERRLPSASDLNLSSAISVHPPTSRDRDGFAVPHPPSQSSRATVNNNVDRPSRPPTVDLTQEISPVGSSMGNRFPCSQCDKTFPSQALLSDHSKVHQQQQQTRMPYKCHLCTAGFSSQKGQQNHYQQFHQIHLSAADLAIPIVDFRNPVNIKRMINLGIRSFLPLSNLQNRGAGGVLGIPILGLENVQNGPMTLQQWGITDVLTLGPSKQLPQAPR